MWRGRGVSSLQCIALCRWGTPSSFATICTNQDQVCITVHFVIVVFITKLYLMGEDYTCSNVYICSLLQEVLVKRNRERRLRKIAASYFRYLEKKKKTRKAARQRLQNAIVCSERRFNRELLRLQTAFSIDYERLRCGIPQDEDVGLDERLVELYEKRSIVKDAEIGWLRDGVSVLHEIDGTGFTMFGGNLQEIGKSKEGRSALLHQLDGGNEKKDGKRGVLSEVKAVLEEVPSDAFVKEK